jgi:hypothetical protein
MLPQDDRTHAELLIDLRNGSRQAQEEALARLAAVGEAEALDAIVNYLGDQPPGEGGAGLDALRVLAYKYAPVDRYGLADALIPFLAADQWDQRLTSARLLSVHPNELATDALRDLVYEARDRLEEERRNRTSNLRSVVERTLVEGVMAMAYSGRLLVLPDVIEMLDDRPLRALATRAIGIIGSETEVDRLEELAEDEDYRVRDAAQWALGLMDERREMLMRPPDQMPEPPPERLSPIYWAHRQLYTGDDDVVQFLVVRVAIEHLLLDARLSESTVPEQCTIILRRYEGQTPPEFKSSEPEIVGMWRYYFQGPDLVELEIPKNPPATPPVPGASMARTPSITITYPVDLPWCDEGIVSFDCLIEPRKWESSHFRIMRRDIDGAWSFYLLRKNRSR